LSTKFGVRGIPTFVIVNADGTNNDMDGRTTVTSAKGDIKKALAKWGSK
jgi:hypothetical protein